MKFNDEIGRIDPDRPVLPYNLCVRRLKLQPHDSAAPPPDPPEFPRAPLELASLAKLIYFWSVVAVFSFLNHWNDFFNPLIFLSITEKYTLALGINLFRGYQVTQWHLLMAASVMVSFPCILLYALAQRYFIQRIVFTGVTQ